MAAEVIRCDAAVLPKLEKSGAIPRTRANALSGLIGEMRLIDQLKSTLYYKGPSTAYDGFLDGRSTHLMVRLDRGSRVVAKLEFAVDPADPAILHMYWIASIVPGEGLALMRDFEQLSVAAGVYALLAECKLFMGEPYDAQRRRLWFFQRMQYGFMRSPPEDPGEEECVAFIRCKYLR